MSTERAAGALPVPEPPVTVETEPFWQATAQGRLVLPRCDRCATVIWYPRRFCPACSSQSVTWFEATGRGSIYSFTVIARGGGAYADAGPFVLAYVELDEGPRLLTNIVDADPAALSVGDPVEVAFAPTADGSAALPRFRPRR